MTSFELTSVNSDSLATGLHTLDALVSRFSNFESSLYYHTQLSTSVVAGMLGLSGFLAATVTDFLWTSTLRNQLWADVSTLTTTHKYVSAQLGVTTDAFNIRVQGLTYLFESADIFLLGFELLCAVFLFAQVATFKGKLQKQILGYDDVVTFCQVRGVSVAEMFGLLTFALGFVFFDMFVSLAEDDSLEALSYVFASVIVCAVVLLFLAADVQFYFLISSISGGELTLRILYTDIVNNALCLLRVFFCWIRYLFYDLQAELVDLAFHYTEFGDEATLETFPSLDALENSQL
jgi:hypothetical protein